MKINWKKLGRSVNMALVLAFLVVSCAFAQGDIRPGDEGTGWAMSVLWPAVIIIFGLGIAGMGGTDVLKILWNKVAKRLHRNGGDIEGDGSAMIAALLVTAVVLGFDLDAIKEFSTFAGLDDKFTVLLTMVAGWYASKSSHNVAKYVKEDLLDA